MPDHRLKQIRSAKSRQQGGLCYWCGLPMLPVAAIADPQRCTADHLVPSARGGKTIWHNIVAAHFRCNQNRQRKGHPGYYGSARDAGPPQAALRGKVPMQ